VKLEEVDFVNLVLKNAALDAKVKRLEANVEQLEKIIGEKEKCFYEERSRNSDLEFTIEDLKTVNSKFVKNLKDGEAVDALKESLEVEKNQLKSVELENKQLKKTAARSQNTFEKENTELREEIKKLKEQLFLAKKREKEK